MSLEAALTLAAKGFYVFPTYEKIPIWPGWPDKATRDPAQLKKWWTDPVLETEKPYEASIATGKFDLPDGRTVSLLVLDLDMKDGRDGISTAFDLELEHSLPPTYTQGSKTGGGQHRVYWSPQPCRNSVDKWPGVDIRGRGGFIVGAGSTGYTVLADLPVVEAPASLVGACAAMAKVKPAPPAAPLEDEAAFHRAMTWLADAPAASQGQGGDALTYRTCCVLKDMGVSIQLASHALVQSGWNDRCDPPWDLTELDKKVQNAYLYGAHPPGYAAPEQDFEPVPVKAQELLSIESINRQFAWVAVGGSGSILWESTGVDGQRKVQHLNPQTFHDLMAPRRPRKISRRWMAHPHRRTYHGVVFAPERTVDPRWYNLWTGFTATPAAKHEIPTQEADWALKAWKEHLLCNLARGDESHAKWIMAWLAHLIQKPWERPRVALVLKGLKGVGKSFWIETVGRGLLGPHFRSVSDGKRFLFGNFNAHLENCLLLVFEEAFWAADVHADGILKDLITRTVHPIERKYHEVYDVEALTRICIIGNDEWLVPASHDERRYAVFEVGAHRRNDHAFFGRIQAGMRHYGGLGFLLRELQQFPLGSVNLNAAPATKALVDQKTESLNTFHQWWLDSLTAGEILELGATELADAGSGWPRDVKAEQLRTAYSRYCRARQIKTRLPADVVVIRMLKHVCPNVHRIQKRANSRATASNYWQLPPLGACRDSWDEFIGGKREWD